MRKSDRLEQVSFMFSEITGMTLEDSKSAVLSTSVGKKIRNHNQTYLYDQPAANLFEIMKELENGTYGHIVPSMDMKSILDAQKKMYENEKVQVTPLKFSSRKSMKKASKRYRKEMNREYLRAKRDSAVNVLKAKTMETIVK